MELGPLLPIFIISSYSLPLDMNHQVEPVNLWQPALQASHFMVLKARGNFIFGDHSDKTIRNTSISDFVLPSMLTPWNVQM